MPRDKLDGQSLVLLLREPKRSTGRAVVTMFDPGNASLRARHWGYIRYADGSEELYDHRQDPHEWKNLGNNPECAEIKAKLAKRLPKMNVPLHPGTLKTKKVVMEMGWGTSVVHADPAGVKDPVHLPTRQLMAFYSKHHGDRLVKTDAIGVPTYELPYRMGGVSPKKKVAAIDLAATAHETATYVHAINRSFNTAMEVIIKLSGFERGEGAVHRMVQGRLNDGPKNGEPGQIGREIEREIEASSKAIKVTLPKRSVSCIEIPLAASMDSHRRRPSVGQR